MKKNKEPQPKKKRRLLDETTKRLIHELRPIRGWVLLSACLSLLLICCAVAAPKLMGAIVDELYVWTKTHTPDLAKRLLPGAALLFGVYALQSAMSYGNAYLLNNFVTRYFTAGLRIRLSEKLRRLPVSYVDKIVAPLAITSAANSAIVFLNSASSTSFFLLASLMPNWMITKSPFEIISRLFAQLGFVVRTVRPPTDRLTMPFPGASDGLSASPQLPSFVLASRGARVESPIKTMLAAETASEAAMRQVVMSVFMAEIIAHSPLPRNNPPQSRRKPTSTAPSKANP